MSPPTGPGIARAPAIELAGLTKRYVRSAEQNIPAVNGIDLSIAPAEYLSIEGPSGCGKTTLLNLLGLLDAPTQGEIRWDGVPVSRASEREKTSLRLRSIGFVFQRFYLLATLTARENVELPMRAAGVPREERRRRAEELLRRVGLEGKAEVPPSRLSGGEEQRVAIARALANRPRLLLADEPTGELDSENARVVMQLLETSQREAEATLIVVTHNPEVAARARRHLGLRDGRLWFDRSGE